MAGAPMAVILEVDARGGGATEEVPADKMAKRVEVPTPGSMRARAPSVDVFGSVKKQVKLDSARASRRRLCGGLGGSRN
jgi:hypothetical protein